MVEARGPVSGLDRSVFIREGSIMQAVCTTGPLHCGKTLTWSSACLADRREYDDECVFIDKWLDADCSAALAQPLVLVSVTSLNSSNDVGEKIK